MRREESFFQERFSRLRVAGKEIRAQLVFAPAPPLDGKAHLLRRTKYPLRRAESAYWQNGAAGRYRLTWSNAGTFDLDARRGCVVCHLRRNPSLTTVEEVLRGPVCSFFLLENGFEPLHAGAVIVNGECLAFVGAAGAGKSSLIAYLVQRGAQFFSDDVLPVRAGGKNVRAYPGLPQVRLVPRALRALRMTQRPAWATRWKATLPMASRVRRASYPVVRLYLLERRAGARAAAVRLMPLAPREAFLALVSHTTNNAQDAAWRLETQLHTFGWLADRVPMRRLSYASGFSRLGSVRRAILRDLAS